MRNVVIAALAAVVMCGCGSSTPSAQSPSAQATASASVQVAIDVWNIAANTCEEVMAAQEADGGAAGAVAAASTQKECLSVLLPAHDAIDAANSAVNAWVSGGQSQFPCLMANVVASLKSVDALFKDLGVSDVQVVDDILALASAASPNCASDAGAQ